MKPLLALALAFLLGACAVDPPIAQMTYGQVMERALSDRTFDTDAGSVSRVQAIAGKIHAAALAKFPNAPASQVHVLNYKPLGLWSFAGNRVFVYQGIIDASSDDELAMALAHEMAHGLLKHVEAFNQVQRTSSGSVQTLTMFQNFELEADRVGMQLAIAAGYKREAMASVLRKIAAQSPTCHEATCSHPNWERRIEQAKGDNQ